MCLLAPYKVLYALDWFIFQSTPVVIGNYWPFFYVLSSLFLRVNMRLSLIECCLVDERTAFAVATSGNLLICWLGSFVSVSKMTSTFTVYLCWLAVSMNELLRRGEWLVFAATVGAVVMLAYLGFILGASTLLIRNCWWGTSWSLLITS